METPPSVSDLITSDSARANAIINAVLDDGRTVLTEPEATDLLSAFGIPTVETVKTTDLDETTSAAERLGFPVALKILSRDITHKSDVGGVQLNLTSAATLTQAAQDMVENVRRKAPAARIDGFTIQRMIRRPKAQELILGMIEDAVFGPVLLFGQGGTAVEVIADRVVGLPPLNPVLAREMIERTRVYRLLRGYRDRPAADLDAIALMLVKVSHLVSEIDRIAELDINPLLADATGVMALDARIVLRPRGVERRPLAIRPYPRELEQEIETWSGRYFFARPIRPEDEPALVDMLRRSSLADIRLRFFASMKEFPHAFAARLTQIDYDREMALIALTPESQDICGVVRLVADPDNQAAEFAVMVRSDLKGAGLGYSLVAKILDYARARGIRRVFGDVLRENTTMLQIAKEMGFAPEPGDGQSDAVTVALDLS